MQLRSPVTWRGHWDLCEPLPWHQPAYFCFFFWSRSWDHDPLGEWSYLNYLLLAWGLKLVIWLVICGQTGLLPLQRYTLKWLWALDRRWGVNRPEGSMHEWFSQFNHKDSLGSHGSGVVLMTLTLELIVVHHTLEPLIAYGLWLLTVSGIHSGGMTDGCFPSPALGSMVLSFDCQSVGPYYTFMGATGNSSQRFFNHLLGINVHHPL